MSLEELFALKNSPEAPYDHQQYTIWLHNKIIQAARYELWQFRENKSSNISSSYAACTNIMALPSLQEIKTR